MVVKMMRWRPWLPIDTKKFQVKLVLLKVDELQAISEAKGFSDMTKLMVEIKWKGQKGTLGSLRRTVKKNFTREETLKENGVVTWNEEFYNVCSLSAYKENVFDPWEIAFTITNALDQAPRSKTSVVGISSLNLAEYASKDKERELQINIPVLLQAPVAERHPSLYLSISLLEVRTVEGPSDAEPRSVVPIPGLSPPGEYPFTEKDNVSSMAQKNDVSALKAGLRMVRSFTAEYVSSRKSRKACQEEESSEERFSRKSDDGECTYPLDTDSPDDLDVGEKDEGEEESSIRKSFSYGTLASTNYFGRSLFFETRLNAENEDLIYYSNRKSDVGCANVEDASTISEHPVTQTTKRSILPWKKRKLNFRSPKNKGEPLLKKAYGEEGGDDIDFDRRQLSSSDESLTIGWNKAGDEENASQSVPLGFGDDNFAVGSWEKKEVVSRDGHMRLCTKVFFASIDQCSERAAGGSACTALVAVIADWFQSNRDAMPVKSQFDSLIREGSLEWRKLCDNEVYRERFPDKHFDLETVLEAKIRPLFVDSEKSFIGFFHPDSSDSGFDFLHGAMSFDSIWDEISRSSSNSTASKDPQVYIVSWNDHFFLLKVEPEAYYIIDTLGERLYEGCDQAYILKFDKDTLIYKLQNSGEKTPTDHNAIDKSSGEGSSELEANDSGNCTEEDILYRGKESCKAYIKSFLAAIPIRELQEDIKKGLNSSTPFHHRLQIELHFTTSSQPTKSLAGSTNSV